MDAVPLWVTRDVWNAINAPGEDERRLDYMEESERRCKLEVESFVVTSMDYLFHHGSTYREAIDKAMAHDGWKGTE